MAVAAAIDDNAADDEIDGHYYIKRKGRMNQRESQQAQLPYRCNMDGLMEDMIASKRLVWEFNNCQPDDREGSNNWQGSCGRFRQCRNQRYPG